jgi:hypothetical protein
LSIDGQWQSFPKVLCLLQYVSNGNYYDRIRVNGKLIRESLKTIHISLHFLIRLSMASTPRLNIAANFNIVGYFPKSKQFFNLVNGRGKGIHKSSAVFLQRLRSLLLCYRQKALAPANW